jgi:hypothetical protein
MMIILAHGALGWADELIFLGIAVIFLGMMGITWVRSQSIEVDEGETQKTQPTPTRRKPKQKDEIPDHFKLD